MARVEADADARVAVEPLEEAGEVLEVVADRRALTGRALEQHACRAAAPRAQDRSETGGDAIEGRGLARRAACAGVQHDAEQPERLGPIDLVGQRRARGGSQGGVGRREVDQVARVRDDGAEAGGVERPAEGVDLGARQHGRPPLIRVAREDLKRVAAGVDGPGDAPRDAAGDRHVGAEAGRAAAHLTGRAPRGACAGCRARAARSSTSGR